MATIERTETVEKTREVKLCDYCRLVTEDDIDEDEEFHTIGLDPRRILDTRNKQT